MMAFLRAADFMARFPKMPDALFHSGCIYWMKWRKLLASRPNTFFCDEGCLGGASTANYTIWTAFVAGKFQQREIKKLSKNHHEIGGHTATCSTWRSSEAASSASCRIWTSSQLADKSGACLSSPWFCFRFFRFSFREEVPRQSLMLSKVRGRITLTLHKSSFGKM